MKKNVPGIKQYAVGCFVSALLFLCSTSSASLEYHELTVEGRGPTLGAAINNALVEAVGQINGKAVNASSMLSSAELSTSKGAEVDYFASESYQRNVATATKGVVSSYEVLSSSENKEGRWTVDLRAQIGKYKQTAKGQRKRIAVMPLRVSASRFSVDGQAFDKEEVARLLGEGISARLTQSRRFTVLDREYMAEAMGEKKLITSGDVPAEEVARLGEELVADYIFVGTLEDMKLGQQKKTMLTGREIESYGGTVLLGFRIIEVATRQVALAGMLDVPVSCTGNGWPGGANVMKLLMPVADEVSEKTLRAIYPLLVLQVRGDQVVLGQGGDGIKEGAVYKVYRYGERMVDPYNGEFLGREEIYCAEIKVDRVLPKQSYAEVLSSEVELATVFAPKTLVCRAISGRDLEKQKKEARDVRTKARRDSLESNW